MQINSKYPKLVKQSNCCGPVTSIVFGLFVVLCLSANPGWCRTSATLSSNATFTMAAVSHEAYVVSTSVSGIDLTSSGVASGVQYASVSHCGTEPPTTDDSGTEPILDDQGTEPILDGQGMDPMQPDQSTDPIQD
ncbi:MAG: hypothetical protein WAN35_14860 [Terracidiphilus sp.]